ncbi:STAS domain-containing protein [Streptomyces sp. NPDC020983]|uniref:STAS domain-containing protein n=1 Tax=Streptomyces sp. NPDC020983 TaxID=3365106 RepID=UPI00379D0281
MQEQHRGTTVVTACGDIDIETAPSLDADLAAALHTHHRVVLDLSDVTFMDCTGLRALVHARNLADRLGNRLVLRGAARPVLRLLRLTGLDKRLCAESG